MTDKRSQAKLALVCPTLAYHVGRLATMLEQTGIVIIVTQGLRSWNEQDMLYQQGRTVPGKVVTNCPGGHSWHNFGLAVDVAPDDLDIPGLQPDWNTTHPVWRRMVEAAEACGFVCGAQWRTFPDNPHLQMTGRFDVNPTEEVRQIFRDGGTVAVWEEAGLK